MTETNPQTQAAVSGEPVRFDAVLQPNTSLSPRAFFLLMTALCFISFCAGILFVMVGAWPVFGFFGLDMALVYIAFRLNYRQARRFETVRLTDDSLVVERVSPTGKRQKWQFQPYWLKVELNDDIRRGRSIILQSHGKTLEIGSFLSANEKFELARALRTELSRLKSASFQPFTGS